MSRRKTGLNEAEWKQVFADFESAYSACVKIHANCKKGLPVHGMAETIMVNMQEMAQLRTGDREFFGGKPHSTP